MPGDTDRILKSVSHFSIWANKQTESIERKESIKGKKQQIKPNWENSKTNFNGNIVRKTRSSWREFDLKD